jgi:hypothetical protein
LACPGPPGAAAPWPRGGPRGTDRAGAAIGTIWAVGLSTPVGTVGTIWAVGPVPALPAVSAHLMTSAARGTTLYRWPRPATITVGPGGIGAMERAPGPPVSGPARWTARSPRRAPAVGPSIGTVKTAPAPVARQLGGDAGHRGRLDQLNEVRVRSGPRARRLDRHHGYPVDTELRLGPDDVSRLGTAVEQSGIQCASRVERARCPPGPSPIGPRACQLYLYAASHRTKVQLPGGSANHSSPTSPNVILSL